MESLRILLLSASRPSRTWKIADRIKREIPEAEISGIVQQAVSLLPLTQQLIVAGAYQSRALVLLCHGKADALAGMVYPWLPTWSEYREEIYDRTPSTKVLASRMSTSVDPKY
jgi:hypothetical protein